MQIMYYLIIMAIYKAIEGDRGHQGYLVKPSHQRTEAQT